MIVKTMLHPTILSQASLRVHYMARSTFQPESVTQLGTKNTDLVKSLVSWQGIPARPPPAALCKQRVSLPPWHCSLAPSLLPTFPPLHREHLLFLPGGLTDVYLIRVRIIILSS